MIAISDTRYGKPLLSFINLLQSVLTEEYQSSIKALKEKLLTGLVRFTNSKGVSYSDWRQITIGEIAIKKSSNISASSLEAEFGTFKIYGANGFLKNISFYNEKEDYIAIVKDGAGVGRLSYCEAKSSVLGTLDIIKCQGATDLKFLYYLLSTIDFTKYITGSTIPHIYFRDYSVEVRLIPCLDEQKRISEILSLVDKKILIERECLFQLVTQKKYFLNSLFK